MDNHAVAKIFAQMADFSEIRGDNVFKVRALRNASELISSLPVEVESLASDPSRLRELKGVGEGIAKKIVEICETGSCEEHRALLEAYPASLLELLEIEGVGPKKVRLFFDAGVRSVEDLERAAKEGRLRGLPRMSAATEAKLLKALGEHKARAGRILLAWAEPVVAEILRVLRGVRGVVRAEAAGSFRRRRDTVGDLDFLVAAPEGGPATEAFLAQGQPLSGGETKCSIKLATGLQADLRVVPEESFGAALHYFTGSKAHNVELRTLAQKRGLSINEYGVFESRADGSPGERIGGREELDIYRALDLEWIPPELREARGEIEAARDGKLPRLIEEADLIGDVHVHTTESDGSAGIEEMALAAARCGRKYLGIADHSKALAMAHGLDEKRLRAHAKEIRRVSRSLEGKIRVLAGIEVDILRDGSLDLEEECLRSLDVVVASVHSSFGLPREEMTARVIRAIDSGSIDIVAHPTGRLLLRREPYAIDMERVMRAAAARGVALELNAFPDRLDLSDVHLKLARELGVKIVINTDSHSTEHLGLMRFGVDAARRGWLEAKDVLNTRDVDEFLCLLHAGHRS